MRDSAGGRAVEARAFPWFVRIFRKGVDEQWGAGAIVGSGWVMTTAHAGLSAGRDQVCRAGQQERLPIVEVHPHPGFRCSWGQFDVCLVRFEPSVSSVGAWRLTQAGDTKVLGWNSTLNQLQLVEIRPATDADCRDLLRDGRYVGSDAICGLSRKPGTSEPAQLQPGDSGGPLLSADLTRVVGVLSRGCETGPNGEPRLAAALAIVITSSIAQWIQEVMDGRHEPFELPACERAYMSPLDPPHDENALDA